MNHDRPATDEMGGHARPSSLLDFFAAACYTTAEAMFAVTVSVIVKSIIINAMTAYQVYEQSVKPLSVAEKLTLARLIINEVVPDAGPPVEASGIQHNATTQIEHSPPAKARQPRQFGAGRHLLSGAGIDIDELMATPIDDMFADYMPE